ncbi:MAG: NHL repeat-containing protein [Planctomycetes bacterium]|nr:NHL repeat-containing protein [Planctomycetota bacterium]
MVDRRGLITRYSPNGIPQKAWPLPETDRGTPVGISVDDDDRVFVADSHYSRILVFDADGRELARFGVHGTGPGQFLLPADVAVRYDGWVFVSEYGGNDRVSCFTPDFRYSSSFGDPASGFSALSRPTGLALDAAGTIWVVDSGNHRLCRFGADGRLLTTVGGLGDGPGEFKYPSDIAVARDGTLVVCDAENSRIVALSAGGESPVGTWGHAGRGPDGLHRPTGVASDGNGGILIADTLNDRVLRIPITEVVERERLAGGRALRDGHGLGRAAARDDAGDVSARTLLGRGER